MTKSLRILLTQLVDYAGLFPPARLPMKASVEQFAKHRLGRHSWMLHRFAVSAARLDEFLDVLDQSPGCPEQGQPWRLTVIAGDDAERDIASVIELNRRLSESDRAVMIESAEMQAKDAETVSRYAKYCLNHLEESPTTGLELYFELSAAGTSKDCLVPLAEVRARAKLRTGGDTAEKFPPCKEVAHFLIACATAGVPFKCSAGLHHPIRSLHRFTYQPDSQVGVMHGFLNVFLAAAFAYGGATAEEVERLLEEQSAEALEFLEEGACWRGHFIGNERLASARQEFCVSFGSCSFEEPLAGLGGLGLL